MPLSMYVTYRVTVWEEGSKVKGGFERTWSQKIEEAKEKSGLRTWCHFQSYVTYSYTTLGWLRVGFRGRS